MISIDWLGVPATIGGILLGVYTTLTVLDRIYRFFFERRLKHFERIIGYLTKGDRSDDEEYPLYAEGLRQELFMLVFSVRKHRLFREELTKLTKSGGINLAVVSELTKANSLFLEDGKLTVSQNWWLLIFGIFSEFVVFLIALPIFGIDVSKLPFPVGVLVMFSCGLLTGTGLGIVARSTIRPFFLAKRMRSELEKYYGTPLT